MKKVIITGLMTILLLPGLVLAQGWKNAGGNLSTAVGNSGLESDITVTTGAVVKGVLALVGTVFFALTVYAGILWMTASGNEEKITTAKDILVAAAIGLFITMSAYTITYFVTGRLGG